MKNMIDDNIMNHIFTSAASEAVDTNLDHQQEQQSKNLSQFIYLQAGDDLEDVEDFLSGTGSSLSLDIMTADENFDVNENDKMSSFNQSERNLQPTPATTNEEVEPLSQSDFVFQQPKKLNHPQPKNQPSSLIKSQHKLLPKRYRHRPSITAEDVKQSIVKTQAKLPLVSKNSGLTHSEFNLQRTQLMTIIVKYIATKIHNSFPPEEPRRSCDNNELPLDKFLLLITSRLKLTLSLFIKGIIYLFRYMDIIYLLRYLNQTNNFVQYNDMGFELKKLIVGCFKIAIIKENRILAKNKRIHVNWEHVTGLQNGDINAIVKKIVSRMNGKLNIKPVELMRMKNEMLRFVNMVTTNA